MGTRMSPLVPAPKSPDQCSRRAAWKSITISLHLSPLRTSFPWTIFLPPQLRIGYGNGLLSLPPRLRWCHLQISKTWHWMGEGRWSWGGRVRDLVWCPGGLWMGLGPTPSRSPLPALHGGVYSGESHRPNGQPQGECSGTISCLPRSGDRSSQMLSCKPVERLLLQLQSCQ